jgi:predicted histone-like DNA-binding protein
MATLNFIAHKQKIGFNKKVAYVLRPWRYSTIRKEELYDMAAQDSGLNVEQLKAASEAVLAEIQQLLTNGHGLELGRLGKIRLVVNAKTVEDAEDVSTDLIRRQRIVLTPSPELKAEMLRTKINVVVEDEGE